jgi:L-rhamnonate dehydratase
LTDNKITQIEIVKEEKVSQTAFPYSKPTDYYVKMDGKSPIQSALIDNVAFLRLSTDNEHVESYLEVSKPVANLALKISQIVIGQRVDEISKSWDMMYRFSLPYGRAGLALQALSAINILMYDACARALDIPVYKLLGGKTREKIRAYASHLHPLPPKELQAEALNYVSEGYQTMKMRFAAGPSDPNAVEKNESLVRALRDAIGYEVELAGDAWMSWTYNFSLKMLKKLEKYELTWIEEPLLPDNFEGYKELCKNSPTPISAGEHHSHVYDFKNLLDSGVRILQPDALWSGGITSLKRIAGLAEAYDAYVIPHNSIPANLSFIASEIPSVAPLAEYLVKYGWMEQRMINPPRPINGYFEVSDRVGLGVEYDLSGGS